MVSLHFFLLYRKTARTKKVTQRKLSSGPGKRDEVVLSCSFQPLVEKATPVGSQLAAFTANPTSFPILLG